MDSLWSAADAASQVEFYAEQGIGKDLALRTYTSRLLGKDPQLVMHGGGNTSVKTQMRRFDGVLVDVLCVKGSGWDLATIEPAGLPAVELAPLQLLRDRERLSDEDMVRFLRLSLLDPDAPNPSVETLLHAYLPHKVVDHAHALAVLAISDQPDGEERCADLYGDRFAIVPWVMPGFELSKVTAAAVDANPDVEGVILHKHGIFTFGDTAQQSYERMIAAVDDAEKFIATKPRKIFNATVLPDQLASVADVAPIIRGTCAEKPANGIPKRQIADFRSSNSIRAFVDGESLVGYATRGVVTPDHVIRTKQKPLIVPPPVRGELDHFTTRVIESVGRFRAQYEAYFEVNNKLTGGGKTPLDSMPRVVLVPGIGLFGLGKSAKDAAVAADLAEATIETITMAESVGAFDVISDAELFEMEYWSLEQAKLGKTQELPLARQIAMVTGAAGAIGAAICDEFSNAGAAIVALDSNVEKLAALETVLRGPYLPIRCDVTNTDEVRHAFDRACETFGGLDILVSNAGAAWQGPIGEFDDNILRESFELNFFAHQSVAKNAVRVMRAQDTGGVLLFNASKQAINPGVDFGAYGLPKAATLFLARQYALEYGHLNIRSNVVNADRIRSGLLTDSFIESRARMRDTTKEDYMHGNLLGVEVEATDVAKAFLHQALQLKTTGDVTTVDGGNIAAVLR